MGVQDFTVMFAVCGGELDENIGDVFRGPQGCRVFAGIGLDHRRGPALAGPFASGEDGDLPLTVMIRRALLSISCAQVVARASTAVFVTA